MMMKRSLALLGAATLAACASEASVPEPIAAQPVRIGLDGIAFDACRTKTEVRSAALTVRSAPHDAGQSTDTLPVGTVFSVCDYKEGWSGIVFAPEEDRKMVCGVDASVLKAKDYRGPCRSGWIEGDQRAPLPD